MWTTPGRLHAKGIIGMNSRNIRYIGRYNSRSLYPLVDDKLKTKLLAEQHGIATPALIGTITTQFGIKQLRRILDGCKGFVIKPAKGSGGKGILVIDGVSGDRYLKPSGQSLSLEDVERHVSNILSGLYSLGGSPDVAVIEALINFDERFNDYTYEGVPDIRVIVFKGYPVMAMVRLSTAASDGKANLHQGAVGVGIDIATGHALRGVQYDRAISHHPETEHDLAKLNISGWNTLLQIAASCYEVTGLGYLGTDMVLDREHGPMLLELNARPGLAIQMANGEGLRPRLDLVEKQPDGLDAQQRVAFCQHHFARRLPATSPVSEQAAPA